MPYQRERGGAVFTIFLTVLFFSIIGAGLFAFIQVANVNPLNPLFLENSPPEIELGDDLLGLGADPVSIPISVKDSGMGLDEITVRISQNNEPKELTKKKGLQGKGLEEFSVTINPKELVLHEGKAELQVVAFDRALWSNGSKVSKSLIVDFLKPHIDVVTPQQNAVLGGSELVFYKVAGKRPDSQGVFAQGSLYPGFPAKYWDDAFKSYDDLYLAFFPIAQGFDDSKDKMSLIARDNIGNAATANFNYRVRARRWGSFQFPIDDARAENLKTTLGSHESNEGVKARFSGDLVTDLRYLIKASARHDESILSDPLSQTEGRRLWSGSFLRPVASHPSNTAGDQRVIVVKGQELLKSAAAGSRFGVSSRSKVVAANNGKIAFVGDLILHGTTIVIDHGFGLATVYAHLSEAPVKVGDDVTKGQQIGRTGTSGLAQGEEVYFETRLHGVPVSPNEWWDENWVNDHIDKKVAFVQTDLGGASGE